MQMFIVTGPDHTPFKVAIDGQLPVDGNSYSDKPSCSVGWTSPQLMSGSHKVTLTLVTKPGMNFLEFLGVEYVHIHFLGCTCSYRCLTRISQARRRTFIDPRTS